MEPKLQAEFLQLRSATQKGINSFSIPHHRLQGATAVHMQQGMLAYNWKLLLRCFSSLAAAFASLGTTLTFTGPSLFSGTGSDFRYFFKLPSK